MSLHVNKRRRGDKVTWRLLRSVWREGKVKYEHVPMSDLLQWGLSPELSVEDAVARVKQLNAQAAKDKEGDRAKAGALATRKQRKLVANRHLPERFVAEFETSYLKAEYDIGPSGPAKYKKALFTWGTVQKLIAAVDLPQSQWHPHRRRFYNELSKLTLSPSYTGKVLRILNQWGTFIALKTEGSFVPVPPPRGYDREMIADAYLENGERKKTSAPLAPEALEAARSKLPEPQYRWLYLSIWLGLRPPEVDSLHSSKVTREQGVPVIWVYQSKLRGIKKEDRYKPVPLIYPEQRKCLDYIKQELRRPLVKTVQKHIAPDLNLYGGRKGFTDLMLSKGQALEDISTWLGHATIERTWASYKQRQRVSFRKVS